MQIVGVILLLVSVGLVVGPVGAVVVIYRDDLSGLVIPPEIQDMMGGNGNFILGDGNNNYGNGSGNYSNGNGGDGSGSFLVPVFVGATVDQASRTFTVTVNFTNNFSYDLTLNALNATAEETQQHIQLATVSLSSPVTMAAGETSQVTVAGSWMQAAEQLVSGFHEGQTINVSLINVVIDVNGIIIQPDEPINVGAIPLSLEGT